MAKRKKKKQLGVKGQMLLIFCALGGVILAPTTIILMIGMAPTWVAAFTDKTKEKVRGFTVGAMNLAGCSPFVAQLWTTDHTLERSITILADPYTVMIMYMAAAAGYCLEWAIAGGVSVFVVERAKARIKWIERQQQEIVERWGREVRGNIPLDQFGFALNEEPGSRADTEDDKKN